MDTPDTPPEDALDDIAYLSRSKTRVWILATLSAESSTRGELEDATGIPRTTIDRAVNELENRGWVGRTPDGTYSATSIGERIATESSHFIATIKAIRNLDEAVSWLPHDELTIGLRHFREATVWRPKPNDMNAPDTFATGLMRAATEFACLVNTLPSLAFEEAMMNGVFEGRLATKHVITDTELTTLRQRPDRASDWQAYLEAGADLYCYEGGHSM